MAVGKPAVTIKDLGMCRLDCHKHVFYAGGPIKMGSKNVMAGNFFVVRMGDTDFHTSRCEGSNRFSAMKGSVTVLVNNKPVCRMGDQTLHCGGIGSFLTGIPTVLIGG